MNDSSEGLRTIVYVSSATMDLSASSLERLLVEARDLNLESGVTGALLCGDGNFMQCFEGSATAMALTWDRIRFSRRHRDIIELMNEPVAQRSFGDWQMGFTRSSESDLLRLSTAKWTETMKTCKVDFVGLELLRDFWKNHR